MNENCSSELYIVDLEVRHSEVLAMYASNLDDTDQMTKYMWD